MIINKTNKKKYSNIKISLLSNNNYLNLSNGLIKNSKTLNYKTFISEKDGLFCDKIFGSSNDKCYCNKLFNNYDDQTSICSVCGVESKILDSRRSKFGHLELNDIFINSLYYKFNPSYLSIMLNISKDYIKKILYDNYYIVVVSYIKDLKINKILNFDEYLFYKNKYFNKFYAGTGSKVLYHILSRFDILDEIKNIKKQNINFSILKNKKHLKRYELLKKFFNSNIDLSKILINVILVMPPDLRPIVRLPNSNVVSSDLNELYKRLIDRTNRLKEIKRCSWIPDTIYLNEKKNIQNAIDELFVGGGNNKNLELKSLSENLKGKTGFFRQNLLGKRVDYSGRAVIVSGADLDFGECAIPETMAVELFRPFIYRTILLNKNYNLKTAKDEVDKCGIFTLSILKNIIKKFYILLNRAPTLHRLGLQSFKILLTKDKVIKVHPLVCSAFNADFDGDQMAAHIPISNKSNVEYKNLLFSGNNILHPSNGECCIVPTQEMVLGLHYSTKIFNFKKNTLLFNSVYEVLIAYNYGYINLNSCIFFRFKEISFKNYIYKIYKTTLGRILIFNNFSNKYSFSYFNKILNKKDILKIFNDLSYKSDFNYLYTLSNNLMKLGFNFVTEFGASICVDDMFFCYNKKNILLKSFNIFTKYNIDYLNFFLTKKNKKKKILNLWDLTCDLISSFIFKDLNFSNYIDSNGIFIKGESKNSLYLMMSSGSRGSESQIKQICSNRGFINYKKYGFLEIPVLNSLRDGLNVFEYFYFSHNSRKTLADTALKTASAGYLTRRLVECSNNIFISEFDCCTTDGLFFKNLVYKGVVIENFFERIFGRFNSDNIYFKNKIILKKNTFIDINIINFLKKWKINIIKIRSPLKCKSLLGVCSLCYGLDLSKNRIVHIGEMVGIIAGQSIGEPGTQLTMRTFHTGGVVGKSLKLSFFKSNNKGFLKYSLSLKYVINKEGFKIVISRIGKIKIYNDNNDELESFNVPYSSYLLQNDNVYINKGDLICKWNSSYDLFISENKGHIEFNNFIENYNFIKKVDSNFYEIINNKILPTIDLIVEKNYNNIVKYKLEAGYLILFNHGDTVDVGDVLIKSPLDFDVDEDIVGGLPKINNFFEARIPQNCAVLATCSGVVKFNFFKKKKYINIIDKDNKNLFNIVFPNNKKVLVTHNQYINKGDIIIDGELNPHDLLYIHGLDYLVNYFLEEIKYIYFSQGIKINDKHLEVVLSQMLNNGVVIDPGKSHFIVGEIIPISKINIFNNNISYKYKIKHNFILLGITKKSLKNECFLSAASFQRTTSILSDAAINSKYDNMSSIKNSVMSGGVYIAGSGVYNKILNI
ncbi:DNA-directed RNA polymerase subunit beta' [Candidatus Nasuia deltocephalinicola]|uniref:DNA-directed RNA polymerase subunit beta' n=1 Tax=Candidatus Nasuia deltocephalincola TaxID=1160784 RepID=UPI00216B2AB3|nr:DNA-directed RNA polymerase subunit beta' [Candidatus Nasuia deltocephalinicola]